MVSGFLSYAQKPRRYAVTVGLFSTLQSTERTACRSER
jgi:hypothetical protein